MKPKTPAKRKQHKWLKKAGIILAALLLVPSFLFTVGWFNRDFLIEELQDWYRNNNNGSLEIGDVDATFLEGFPNVGFTIRNIKQTSFDTILDKRSSLSIREARVSIGARDLLIGEVQFKNIEIDKAEIYSEVISEKSIEEYIRLKTEKQEDPTYGLDFPRWLDTERTNFRLREIIFIAKDSMLNKYFNLEVREARGKIRKDGESISGNLDFNVLVNDLGFNTSKGSYINGKVITGKPEFILNEDQDLLDIPEFVLQIGEQSFNTKASFDFDGINAYDFSFENAETNFQQTRDLLPDSLAGKLLAYEFSKPLETKLSLKGKFQYGDVPFINANFSTSDNQIQLTGNNDLSKVNLNGYLTNNWNNTDQKPGKKDIRIYFERFSADLDDIEIEVEDSYYQSSDEAMNFVKADLRMSGSNETLAEALKTDNFNFIGGSFNLETQIDGDIPTPFKILDNSEGRFNLYNTRVVLKKNNLQLPVETLQVSLGDKTSVLETLKINLPNGENLVFQGTVQNFSSLLVTNPEMPATTDVSLDSNELNINDLLSTAMEFIPASEKKSNKYNTLHEAFEAIYWKFQPRFRLDLNTVVYNRNRFEDLEADILFLNPETIELKNLGFNYKNALTGLQGTLRIPDPGKAELEPVFIDVSANSSGPISVFQELFNIKLLDINAGDYSFSGKVTGNIRKFEELLGNADGDLQLKNTRFYYPKAAIDLELDSLQIGVHNGNIEVKPFTVEVEDHNPFSLQARVEQFPGFLVDSLESKGRIFLKLDAPYVNMDKWMETISSVAPDTAKVPKEKPDLHAVFSDIYKFDPEFELVVDSLEYADLVSHDLATRVYFENDSILKLEDLKINYEDSEALIKGQLQARKVKDYDSDQNPFNFDFSIAAEGKSKDLNELLQTVNFVLRSGDFKFDMSYTGQARDLKILNTSAKGDLKLMNTKVDIEGTDIQLPVDSLHLLIENDLAYLENLDINLPGKSSLGITGQIDNFSSFINTEMSDDTHTSSFRIKSPYLSSNDLKKLIGSSGKKKDSTENQKFQIGNLKQILSNINQSYRPSAEIQIDSLIYNKIEVSNFESQIDFDPQGFIRIDETNLQYIKGKIDLQLEAGVENPEGMPVKIRMNIAEMELEKLVEDLDYLNNEDLRNTKKIDGDLDLEIDLTGIMNDNGSVDINSLNGTVQVDLRNLAIYEFDPIIESVVLLKEERFEKLEFQPISQTFEINNGMIKVPRTEIQSTALHLFIEGESKIGEYHNLWISLPWNNILKRRDGTQLPEKLSFEESGAKFYIQIVQDKESEKERKRKLRTKFRLGNRKLRKSKEN